LQGAVVVVEVVVAEDEDEAVAEDIDEAVREAEALGETAAETVTGAEKDPEAEN
jgi:hypothetical protein